MHLHSVLDNKAEEDIQEALYINQYYNEII